MAKNVIINGVTYGDVPYVEIPLAAGDGNARFVDTHSGNAVAGDLRTGKRAWAEGSEVIGSLPVRTEADIGVSGKTVTVPAGLYDENALKAVADGALGTVVSASGEVLGDRASSYPVTVRAEARVSAGGYMAEGTTEGSTVTRYIQTEVQQVSPTLTTQTVLPSPGMLLSGVTVAGVELAATATEGDVLAGRSFFSGSLTRRIGTATVPTVSQDSTTKVLTVL